MPHFGLIDDNLPDEEKFLMRARLHLRGGKIRLERGEFSAGIAALYDGFLHALYWFFLTDTQLKPFLYKKNGSFKEEETLYSFLVEQKKVDGKFDIDFLNNIVDKALKNQLKPFKYKKFIKEFEILMNQLNIIPYDLNLVPQENSITL